MTGESERLQILRALLAATEEGARILDVVSSAPSDAAAIAEIATVLACSESAARHVFNMQLRTMTPANRERLRIEIQELEALSDK